MRGLGCDDTLSGSDGDDTLTGDEGTDTIDGGTGTDTCDAESGVNCEVLTASSRSVGQRVERPARQVVVSIAVGERASSTLGDAWAEGAIVATAPTTDHVFAARADKGRL